MTSALLAHAWHFVAERHADQARWDGAPFVLHLWRSAAPVNTASLTMSWPPASCTTRSRRPPPAAATSIASSGPRSPGWWWRSATIPPRGLRRTQTRPAHPRRRCRSRRPGRPRRRQGGQVRELRGQLTRRPHPLTPIDTSASGTTSSPVTCCAPTHPGCRSHASSNSSLGTLCPPPETRRRDRPASTIAFTAPGAAPIDMHRVASAAARDACDPATDPFSRLMRFQPVAVRARTTTSPHGWIPLERTVIAPTDRLMALTWSYCMFSSDRLTLVVRPLAPSVHGVGSGSGSGPAAAQDRRKSRG